MSENKYVKYRAIIDGNGIKWSGFIFAKSQEDAFDIACQVAEGLGGRFHDVIMCYPCEED